MRLQKQIVSINIGSYNSLTLPKDNESFSKYPFSNGLCHRRKSLGGNCQYGLRKRVYNVLSGSILSAWTGIESILNANAEVKLQVCFPFSMFYQTESVL